jgi:glucose-6-phosphate 1-dehydrogenase
VLGEIQIFRIDHYLGKETVQNLLVFRFGNGVFEPGLEPPLHRPRPDDGGRGAGGRGRGGFYDQAGLLRDMIQNHMFQLLALVAMEPPISFPGRGVRNEKVKVLEAIRPMLHRADPGQTPCAASTARAGARASACPATAANPRSARSRRPRPTPPVKLQVDNWRWAGRALLPSLGQALPGGPPRS